MQTIFNYVVNFLSIIAHELGLSYTEVNIVVYFILLPFMFVVLIDVIARSHQLKLTYGTFWLFMLICIPNFEQFSDALFDQAVCFLKLFDKVGLDYVQASVVVCVLLPLVIFATLVWVLLRKDQQNCTMK